MAIGIWVPLPFTFGGSAVVGAMPVDQKLCVPAFQRVCQYRVLITGSRISFFISEWKLKIVTFEPNENLPRMQF
jgi:hypothetical protein